MSRLQGGKGLPIVRNAFCRRLQTRKQLRKRTPTSRFSRSLSPLHAPQDASPQRQQQLRSSGKSRRRTLRRSLLALRLPTSRALDCGGVDPLPGSLLAPSYNLHHPAVGKKHFLATCNGDAFVEYGLHSAVVVVLFWFFHPVGKWNTCRAVSTVRHHPNHGTITSV